MTFQWNSPINTPQRLLPWLWLFMLLMSPVSQADQVPWLDSVEQAMQASQQTGRPILLHFYSNNCPPCKLLDNRAFEDKQLLQSMSEQIIPVKVNVDDHRELADRFQVTRWPTDLYLFPNGTELYRAVSPQDPAVYRQMLDRVALRNRDWVLEQNARFAATERRNALANNRPNPPLQTGMERTQPTALDNPTNQMPTQRRISAAPVSYPVANSDEEVATNPMSSSATLTRTEEQPVNRYKSVRQSPPAGSLSSMTNPYAFEPPSSNMAEMDSPNPPAAMTPPPTRQPTSASLVSSPSSASASANATSASSATGTKSSDVGNVVFDGCCPVALAGSNPAWVEGNASFAVRPSRSRLLLPNGRSTRPISRRTRSLQSHLQRL